VFLANQSTQCAEIPPCLGMPETHKSVHGFFYQAF
jgi:hypothetical protein